MEYDTFPEMEVVSPHEPMENLRGEADLFLRVASLQKQGPK